MRVEPESGVIDLAMARGRRVIQGGEVSSLGDHRVGRV